jgi:hypothetical protein
MINILKLTFQAVISLIMALPYITNFCVGLYSIFLTIISVIADNNDRILTAGYGMSSVVCITGSIYGAVTESYTHLYSGPILLFIVYGYHRRTYG